MQKAQRVILITFVAIGLIFLAVGLAFGSYYERRTEGMVPVTGFVNGYMPDDKPLVEFTFGNQTYQAVGSIDNDYDIGDSYDLMVNPNQPSDYMDATFQILMWVFSSMGVVMLFVGIIAHACIAGSQRRREALLSYGCRTTGTVTDIKEIKSVSVGKRHPWIVTATCTHPVTGESVTLRSHQVWTCTLLPGQHVDIAFDPINEKKYAMDIRETEGGSWA